MIQLKYKIIISLIISILLLNIPAQALFSVAQSAGKSGNSSVHGLSIFDVANHDHWPACSNENHKNTDHSHFICEHHSSLYFGCQSLLVSYFPNITAHIFNEPIDALPEVYLEKFIPPQNLV
jgi:hypothetical protein